MPYSIICWGKEEKGKRKGCRGGMPGVSQDPLLAHSVVSSKLPQARCSTPSELLSTFPLPPYIDTLKVKSGKETIASEVWMT
jgi:hypothetical protein